MKTCNSDSAKCLTALLLVFILFSTFSHYPTTRKTENRPTLQKAPETPNLAPDIYQDSKNRELRRNALLAAPTDRSTLLTASLSFDNKNFYEKVKVEAYCSVKTRIGESGDGGKVVCNPRAAKDNCTLLSLGLNNQIGYDLHIYDVTGRRCKIIGGDKDPQNEATKQEYEKMGGTLFSGWIPDNVTIPEMLKKTGRDDVELMKIDIEGGEFSAVEPLIQKYFVCQIFIEVHGEPAKHLQMLQTIAKYGFRIFNVEANPLCDKCCEYALINEMCMHQFGVVPLAITIPQ